MTRPAHRGARARSGGAASQNRASAKRPEDPIALWLQQTTDFALIVLDNEGTVTRTAGAVQGVLGYRDDELVGRPGSVLFTPEDRALGLHAHELALAAHVGRSQDDRWHVRGDGVRAWISGVLAALTGADGRPAGFVKVMRDRTDLRSEIDALRNRLAAATRARDAIAGVLGVLAHELRNPLQPLAATAQLLQRVNHDERLRKPLQIIEHEVALLKRLVDDVMDVLSIETGKLQFAIEPIDLRVAIQRVIEPRLGLAGERDIEVVWALPPAPITIEADPQRIEQIIANLLMNALKYTPPGGRVTLEATIEGFEAVMRVSDTGIGISPDMLPRIFDLFTQEPAAQGQAAGGLGIGLALVKSLVDAHGGIVGVRSEGRGLGSEFVVRLPLRQPAGRAASAQALPRPAA